MMCTALKKVIKCLCNLLNIERNCVSNDFIGHIGGDDFIVVASSEKCFVLRTNY